MKTKKGPDDAMNGEELFEFNPNLPEELRTGDEKYDELQAQFLRLQADFENFKRRNATTASVMYNNGINDIMVEILPVLDYLDMAIEAQKDDEQRKGIELVKNEFMKVVKMRGVEEMGAVGDVFDPNKHEAVLTVPAMEPDKAGKVVDIVKKGYAKEEKILRHAKVVVAQ